MSRRPAKAITALLRFERSVAGEAEVGPPLVARALGEDGERLGAMALERGAVAAVHTQEVRDDTLVVELALLGKQARVADVLDVVAELTERQQAVERLRVRRVVIAPDLMAVEAAARAADGATVAEAGVDAAAQRIPRRARQHIAQVSLPARRRHQLDGEAQPRVS